MNGPHDLGGAMGFGPVSAEIDEPVFHHPWERRAFALTIACGALGLWSIDASRSARENLAPKRYLSSSYYTIWLDGLARLLEAAGEGPSSGELGGPSPLAGRVLAARNVTDVLLRGGPTLRVGPPPAFAIGTHVRARNIHPKGHTRLPRYVRGKVGVVTSCHGRHVFPDSNAAGAGEAPQPLYTVRFDAHTLWGPDGEAGTSVQVDLWESYPEVVAPGD